jgi:hypothetical protein
VKRSFANATCDALYQVEAGDGGAVYTGIAAAFEGCKFASNNASGNVSVHRHYEL